MENALLPPNAYVLHMSARVKDGAQEAFKAATLENARRSLEEEGCLRYELQQSLEDPCLFFVCEAYASPEAHLAHRVRPYVDAWRAAVNGLMAAPRSFGKYKIVR